MYRYMVIYQKMNGELLYRVRKTIPNYSKGNTTSYGWKVLDIKRLDKGNIYSTAEFDCRLSRRYKIHDIVRNLTSYNMDIFKILFFLFLIYKIYVK